MTAQRPSIDTRVIQELKALDEGQGELLKQLVEMFVGGGEERIALLESAHRSGDAKALNAEAHSLKSSAANLGANRMSELCFVLEQTKDPAIAQGPGTAETLKQLRIEFASASRELQAFVDGSGSAA